MNESIKLILNQIRNIQRMRERERRKVLEETNRV